MLNNPRSVSLLKRVSASAVFRDYEEAFSEATQLPLSLRPTAAWDPSASGKRFENPLCAVLARNHRACAGSVVEQPPVAGARPTETRTVTCLAGLSYSTVPMHLGAGVIGFLHTGQVALQPPTQTRFIAVVKQLIARGVAVGSVRKLEAAYFGSRVLTPGQYHSLLKLLEMFAQHLSLVANQVDVQEVNAESAPVGRAKRFIAEHQGEAVTLSQVARTLHMSTFYFCKTFKKATGLTFTDYLGRVRIETAKGLLLNPNRRVSEVAYTVGFGSLTHFNRLFSKHACQSPTAYRAALPALAGVRA